MTQNLSQQAKGVMGPVDGLWLRYRSTSKPVCFLVWEMKKSFVTIRYLFFLKIEVTDFGVPFIPYADITTRLSQASEYLMSAPDFWPDTSAGYGT